MERTLDELRAETSNAQQNLQIMSIVRNARSAQEAENKVAELEFPTPTLREARLLWKLSRKIPEEFEATLERLESENGAESNPDVRIFPASYSPGLHYQDVPDLYGSVVVKPHPVLPPIFWGYTLLDEDSDVVCSTQGVGGKHQQKAWKERVECVLAHGSRSLPAALKICFEEELDGFKIEFVMTAKSIGCSPAYTNTFTWTRHIVTPNKSRQSGEWYERTTSHSESGEDENRALFKRLTEEEVRAFHEGRYEEGKEYWALVLETDVNAPLDEQFSKYIHFLVVTVYGILWYTKWRECTSEKPFIFEKLEKAHLPCRNSGSVHFGWSPLVSHTGIHDNRAQRVRTHYTTVERAIYDILRYTPDKVNGLAALWNLFGFKSTHYTHVYNLSTVEEIEKRRCSLDGSDILPLWRPKKD